MGRDHGRFRGLGKKSEALSGPGSGRVAGKGGGQVDGRLSRLLPFRRGPQQ